MQTKCATAVKLYGHSQTSEIIYILEKNFNQSKSYLLCTSHLYWIRKSHVLSVIKLHENLKNVTDGLFFSYFTALFMLALDQNKTAEKVSRSSKTAIDCCQKLKKNNLGRGILNFLVSFIFRLN